MWKYLKKNEPDFLNNNLKTYKNLRRILKKTTNTEKFLKKLDKNSIKTNQHLSPLALFLICKCDKIATSGLGRKSYIIKTIMKSRRIKARNPLF